METTDLLSLTHTPGDKSIVNGFMKWTTSYHVVVDGADSSVLSKKRTQIVIRKIIRRVCKHFTRGNFASLFGIAFRQHQRRRLNKFHITKQGHLKHTKILQCCLCHLLRLCFGLLWLLYFTPYALRNTRRDDNIFHSWCGWLLKRQRERQLGEEKW